MEIEKPLVSIICLCYNHVRFVEESIQSVLNQTYPNIELIVIDDASRDGSDKVIERIAAKNSLNYIQHTENKGNCRSFNEGYRMSKGKYLIDLSADDVLLPNRVEVGVQALEEAGTEFGVQFSDAINMDQDGIKVGLHSDRFPHHSIPQGNIYTQLIERYFICSPTMMIARATMDALKGYDENLAYEDFDFWIRSSRDFKYVYMPQALVKRRILNYSMRKDQFKRGSRQMRSTFEVCKKIKTLNKSSQEDKALNHRLWYELKIAMKVFDLPLAFNYIKLLTNR